MTAVLSLVFLDERGIAWIEGANTKVKELILDWMAHGYSPAEIHFQYPHRSLAQIHAAFSYYYEHQSQMDAEIDADYREVTAMRAQSGNPITRQELLERLERL
jgi:uncharacterized protein (DUF433 family)